PDGDAFGGAMGEVVLYGTSFLTEDDRKAMATYLLDDHTGG
ncbi:MAG: cytochrome C, partial [Armatimonadetes bacterium]|nr:cytochrome C [Armatimonadota bacterium]NIO96891.1 cytochrome C [Armatimonadota bacterium]